MTRRKPTKYNRREALAGYLFISPWIVGFLIFTAGTMIYSLVISFSHFNLATNIMRPAGPELSGPTGLPSVVLADERTMAYAK